MHIFAPFILLASCGTPVMLLPLRGGGFGTQLPPKIGSPAKAFLLAPRALITWFWGIVYTVSTICSMVEGMQYSGSMPSIQRRHIIGMDLYMCSKGTVTPSVPASVLMVCLLRTAQLHPY